MARKRGGLAGFYDRNKGFLQKAVPAALSFVPGVGIPLAAGAGALMRGMDRPGQSGIGFNAFEGLKGGVEGAIVGAGTQGARALLTGGGPLSGAVPKVTGGGMPGLPSPNMSVGITPGSGGITKAITAPVSGGGSSGVNAAKSLFTGGRNFMRENKDLIEMAGKGVQRFLPNPELDIKQQEMDLAQAKFDEEKRLTQMEQERRQRVAQLLMPYLQQNYGQYFGGQ